jgi:hypothetical protein
VVSIAHDIKFMIGARICSVGGPRADVMSDLVRVLVTRRRQMEDMTISDCW